MKGIGMIGGFHQSSTFGEVIRDGHITIMIVEDGVEEQWTAAFYNN